MKSVIAAAVVIGLLTACGGGAGLGGSNRRVDEVSIQSDDIEVGEETKVEVFFQTETEFLGDPKEVDLVINLGAALKYVPRSSSLYDGSTHDRDDRSPDRIISCENGETFLVYRYGEDDLKGNSLNGGTQFGMRFKVEGRSPTQTAVIEASAGSDQEYSCDEDFVGEESDSTRVL